MNVTVLSRPLCSMNAGRDSLTVKTNTFQDISGTISLVIEIALVIVNLFPIFVVLKGKKFQERTVTDELVVALSVTDILGVLVPTPVALFSHFKQTWHGGYRACVFYQITSLWFQIVSLLIITYMCLDRSLVLRKALYYKVTGVYSADKVKYIVLILYGLSLGVVTMPVSGLATVSTVGNVCESWLIATPKYQQQSTFYLTLLSLGYFNMLSVALLNISVVSMMWKLKRKMKPLRGGSLGNHLPELQTERKTIFEYSWMTTTVSVIFYLTGFPALLMLTLKTAGRDVSDVAVLYAFLSTTLTGLVNPLIYGLFSKSYRRGYKHIVSAIAKCLCKCPKRKFELVPAIASEHPVSLSVSDDFDTLQRSRNYLKKSKSFHDKPVRGGFQNLAFDTSVHSELCGYGREERFRRKHSNCEKLKRTRSQTQCLTPIGNCNCPLSDDADSCNVKKLSSSNSSLSSSIASDGRENFSVDSDDEMEESEVCNNTFSERNSTSETCI